MIPKFATNQNSSSTGKLFSVQDLTHEDHCPGLIVSRQLINLPTLNATADKIFDRIIPAPNGDCKLLAYPGDQYFPDLNITATGLPSGIACGLTAAINVDGVAMPIDGATNGQTPQNGADPNNSTTSGSGAPAPPAYVAPPPKAPFKPLDPTKYVCIAHDNDPPFCLPPGSYHKQSGLGFEIKDVDSLTLPPGGWSLVTQYKPATQGHAKDQFVNHTYTRNQDPTKPSSELQQFKDDMHAIERNRDSEATFTVIGPNDGPDPVCCLFLETKFGGNVWCVGEGGDDVLSQWNNTAQSVSTHNGAEVWLYAQFYGDAGAALVDGNVEDLKDTIYGNGKKSFLENVKALWCTKSTG